MFGSAETYFQVDCVLQRWTFYSCGDKNESVLMGGANAARPCVVRAVLVPGVRVYGVGCAVEPRVLVVARARRHDLHGVT